LDSCTDQLNLMFEKLLPAPQIEVNAFPEIVKLIFLRQRGEYKTGEGGWWEGGGEEDAPINLDDILRI
jgi:hypothetical protein